MSGTSASRTGRVRVLIVDDEPVMRRLRYENPELPVLMLTARDSVEHPIDGLANGADDSVRVLGDLVLTGKTREVHRAGRPIRLTDRESDRLSLLLDHPRQVLGRDRILDHVRNSSFDGGGDRVEVSICSLRRKIDKRRTPMIHTVRGMGYTIRPTEDGR